MGHHHGSFTDDSPPILTKIETRNTDGHPTSDSDPQWSMEMRNCILLPSFQPKGQEMCEMCSTWLVGLDFD